MRIGVSRRLPLLAAAVSLAAMTSGCAGDGGRHAPSEDVRALAGVTADHGLDPGSRITVEPGMAEERGNVTIRCPADTPACVVVVAADGSVGYDRAGGLPAIEARSRLPDSVEDLLRRRLHDSTWPVAVSFGGGIATCDAVGCPVPDAIHVDRLDAGGARRPQRRSPARSLGLRAPRTAPGHCGRKQGAARGRRAARQPHIGPSAPGWTTGSFSWRGTATPASDITRPSGSATRATPARLTSPGGTATWSGVMSGVDTSPSGEPGAFVHGDSAVVVSGLAAGADIAVDVAFTNIVNEDTGAGVADIVWRGLPLQGREFRRNEGPTTCCSTTAPGISGTRASVRCCGKQGSLFGRLYGPDHEEVGGLFHRQRPPASQARSRADAIGRQSPPTSCLLVVRDRCLQAQSRFVPVTHTRAHGRTGQIRGIVHM